MTNFQILRGRGSHFDNLAKVPRAQLRADDREPVEGQSCRAAIATFAASGAHQPHHGGVRNSAYFFLFLSCLGFFFSRLLLCSLLAMSGSPGGRLEFRRDSQSLARGSDIAKRRSEGVSEKQKAPCGEARGFCLGVTAGFAIRFWQAGRRPTLPRVNTQYHRRWGL